MDARRVNPLVDGVRRKRDSNEVAELLASLGIGASPVVIYGAHGGSDAAFLWWTLRAAGHADVWILDGGFDAWRGEGLLVTADVAAASPTEPLPLAPDPTAEICIDEMKRRLGDPALHVFDTRGPDEFSGEDQLAERGGHIPGARLLPWDRLLGGAPPRLAEESVLRAHLAGALESSEAVTYCQSGPRATHTYAVLEMLGHPRPRLYLGSWAEWGNDAAAPIEAGAAAGD